MAQFARPDEDIAAGSWTTSPLWSKIDEGADGGDTIQSENVGNGINTSNFDFGLSTVSDPFVSTGHILRVRWGSTSTRDITGNFELWEGTPGTGTLVASVSFLNLDTTETTSTHTLTGTEADSISDYGNLNGRLYGVGSGGGPNRGLVVEFAELETPNAGTPPDTAPLAMNHYRQRRN